MMMTTTTTTTTMMMMRRRRSTTLFICKFCLFLLLLLVVADNNEFITIKGGNNIRILLVSASSSSSEINNNNNNNEQQQQTCSANDQTCQAAASTNNVKIQDQKNTDDDNDNDNDEDYNDDGQQLPSSSRGGKHNPNCIDENDKCEFWASSGECKANPNYMLKFCQKSCFVCNERIYNDKELEVGLDLGVKQLLLESSSTSSSPRFGSITKEQAIQKIQQSRDFLLKNNKDTDDDLLPSVKKMCTNQHTMCTIWAVSGECTSNKKYMDKTCTAACESCIMLTREGRCPIDPNEPNVWKSNDLNQMFIRLTQEPYKSKYDVTILSSPNNIMKSTTTDDDKEEEDDDDDDEGGPWVITMENVVTQEEAQTLIELGLTEGYKRSSDVGKINADGTYEMNVNEGRTSSNAWCQNKCWKHPTSQRIVERLSNITGIPDVNSEYLQLLQYEPGQKYQTHHDYIPHLIRRQQGVRILTLYLYLSEVEAGGGTNFDQLNITVMPKVGRALLWPSVLNDDPNKKDDRTTHQALPVEAGIKYGANAWFHMRDFKGPLSRRCD